MIDLHIGAQLVEWQLLSQANRHSQQILLILLQGEVQIIGLTPAVKVDQLKNAAKENAAGSV